MRLLFKFDYANGWGDTFLSVFDIINCINYVKENHPQIDVTFLINDVRDTKNLEKVLNFEYFHQICEKFEILYEDKKIKTIGGVINYKDENFTRLYSGRNDNPKNDIPGIFDVFCTDKDITDVIKLNIPFISFTFNDKDDRVKYFPIFNKDIIENVKNFIEENFNEEFDTIYYRSLNPPNNESIEKFKNRLNNLIEKDKKYFMCSNSAMVKKIIKDEGINVIFFRDLENHSMSHIPPGGTLFNQKDDDVFFPVTEMIIMGESSKILYQGEINMVSLFNWYAINVKKVKLIEL